MIEYRNINGTRLQVLENGKGFITRRYYLATTNTPAEVVEKKHKCYSAVEKLIARGGFNLVYRIK